MNAHIAGKEERTNCRFCGHAIRAGDWLYGDGCCSKECDYHLITGGRLTYQEELDQERFHHRLAAPGQYEPMEDDCKRCGKPFVPGYDGADGYCCAPCVPLQEEARIQSLAREAFYQTCEGWPSKKDWPAFLERYRRRHGERPTVAFPNKIEGGRIVVDEETLEADKFNEEN